MKNCLTCRWCPDKWDRFIAKKPLGNCRAPLPFWIIEVIERLHAPHAVDIDDFGGIVNITPGKVIGEWDGDFPDECEAWELIRE